jgi:predicted Ser/Thr protein kinase
MHELTGYPDACRARFHPERVLGEGGFGRVFLATEVSLGRPVAIKVLSSSGDAESLGRFRAEARATAALAHAGIVQVIDHGVDRGVPWIAYEYIEGESLRARLARGPLPARDALEAGVQIADALQAAHERGVIHRDVKPENVLAIPGELYKVIDFGIARWDGSGVRTRTGVIVGTAAYIAPEIIQGHEPAPSADIYALGVLLFELLAGRVPFQGERPLDVIEAHLRSTPPSLIELGAAVPPSTAELVNRILAKDPRERPPTMAALRHALQKEIRALHPDRVARSPAPPARVSTTAAPAPRLRHALIAVGVIGLCIGLASRPSPPPARVGEERASPESTSRTQVIDALRAFGARKQLDALSQEWLGSHGARGTGSRAGAAARDPSGWLAAQWARVTRAFADSGAAAATAAWRRAVEARPAPLAAEDLPLYHALHELADLQAFFRDTTRATNDAPSFDQLEGMPEPWRGRAPPSIASSYMFALVAATGGKSGLVPGTEGTCASLRFLTAWPRDDFQTSGYQLDRQASESLFGTVTGAPQQSAPEAYEYDGALPWIGAQALEIGACVRGRELRDALEVRFDRRDGTAPVTLVFGRWKRDRVDGYLRVDPALIPATARLSLKPRPVPWRTGAGLNVEWLSARWQAAGGLPPPRKAPSPRNNLALAYDPVAERVMLFGGNTRFPGNRLIQERMERDTWLWTGERWVHAETEPAPPPGIRHRLLTDFEGKRVILTGGKIEGAFPGDIGERDVPWQWDGMRWTKLATPAPPPPGPLPPGAPALAWQTHAFDADRNRFVLVGAPVESMRDPGSTVMQTWVWDAGAWTRARPGTSLGARIEFGLAHDRRRGVTVLFGGQSHKQFHGDTWEFDGATWTLKDGRPAVTSDH